MTSVNKLSPALAAHQENINNPPTAETVVVEDGDTTTEQVVSEDLTKTELLEQARELNIKGRSSMDRDELAEAIEAARAES